MDLLILRHGQSEWNAQGKWQGQADPPLTKVGEKQAKAAAQKLLSVCKSFDKIASSDLRRARRTAEIIAQVNGGDVSVHKEFRERHAGVWQGLTRSEIEASWPNAIADQRWPELAPRLSLELPSSLLVWFLPSQALVVSPSRANPQPPPHFR